MTILIIRVTSTRPAEEVMSRAVSRFLGSGRGQPNPKPSNRATPAGLRTFALIPLLPFRFPKGSYVVLFGVRYGFS